MSQIPYIREDFDIFALKLRTDRSNAGWYDKKSL